MDSVVLDGVQYLRVAVAAKQFDYTPDYLGQLCRAGKLDARLVGRTWFVNPDSVAEHKASTYRGEKETGGASHRPQSGKNDQGDQDTETTGDDGEVRNIKVNLATSDKTKKRKRRPVAPPIKNKTVKAVSSFRDRLQQYGASIGQSYEADDAPLDPEPKRTPHYNDTTAEESDGAVETTPAYTAAREPSPTDATEETPAEPKGAISQPRTQTAPPTEPATSLKVKGERKSVKFKTTDLPEVSLRGKLSVEAVVDQPPTDEKNNKNKDNSPKRGGAVAMTSQSYKRQKRVRRVEHSTTSVPQTQMESAESDIGNTASAKSPRSNPRSTRRSTDQATSRSQKLSFLPHSAERSTHSATILTYRVSTRWIWLICMAALVFGISLILVERQSTVSSDGVEHTWKLRLDEWQ